MSLLSHKHRVFHCNSWSVDFYKHRLYKGSTCFQLAPLECALLRYIIQNPGRYCAIRELANAGLCTDEATLEDLNQLFSSIILLLKTVEPEKNFIDIRPNLGVKFISQQRKPLIDDSIYSNNKNRFFLAREEYSTIASLIVIFSLSLIGILLSLHAFNPGQTNQSTRRTLPLTRSNDNSIKPTNTDVEPTIRQCNNENSKPEYKLCG